MAVPDKFTSMINKYGNKLSKKHKLKIISPRQTFFNTKLCIFCDEKENLTQSVSLVDYNPPGTLIYCKDCKKHADASFLFDVVSKLMLPIEWVIGMDLPKEGFKAKNCRISRILSVGKILIRGQDDKNLLCKDFVWDDLDEQTKSNFKNAIKDKQWPHLYPEWLKRMFKEIKE